MTPDPPCYCLLCGRPARFRGRALDPSRPLVACRYTTPDGKEHSHGTLPGTYDQAEAQALIDARLARRRLADHAHGKHDGKPRPECPPCQVVLVHRRHLRLIDPDPACPHCQADPILSRGLAEPT